jgi:thiol-disulfide isomerase/thioredoxin
MKVTKITILTFIAMLMLAVPSFGADDSNSVTVEQLYPNLAAGVLTYAKVSTLPEGILLKAEGVEISSTDLQKAISSQPQQLQAELKKNAFFVLEQEATGKFLRKLAAEKLSTSGKDVDLTDENQLLQAFFNELTNDVKVTDQDVKAFYKENESVFCGTPLESVRKQKESYVLQDKQQQYLDQYIQTLGQNIEIIVSDSWTNQQAASAKDNPLDKARNKGKPTLAIFSAASCCGPDKMIPVKKALEKDYDGKINIVYIEPRKEQILAARYGIRSIPTQILYDKTGKEYFRHSGFFSEQDIINKLIELGVK